MDYPHNRWQSCTIMFKTVVFTLSGLALAFAGVIALKASQTPEVLAQYEAQHAAQQAKQKEQAALKKQAADYETELYSKSPEARKTAARVILGAQFPGWCDWSSALMVVHQNGEVFVRCNGDFGVDTTRRVAMRLK